jgi:hypothetical protein
MVLLTREVIQWPCKISDSLKTCRKGKEERDGRRREEQ